MRDYIAVLLLCSVMIFGMYKFTRFIERTNHGSSNIKTVVYKESRERTNRPRAIQVSKRTKEAKQKSESVAAEK
jgi:hypothetical protein